MRKASLSRLLARRVDGIFLSDFEQGEIGPDLFRHACLMGLEGMVSKHRVSLYRGGRFRHWVKIKNRAPAFNRVQDQFLRAHATF
jgi:bifunctional non-homologous end joining protein LigD